MLSGEGIEPVPDTFQIVKAETSDSLEDQMNRMKEEELAAVAAGLEDVFFQFDSWSLTPEGKQTLELTLKWSKQTPSSNLIIEGHADQRGTQAYNMVLAKKRATAVQDYLSNLGVDPSRLAIISYGKDKPFCQDATEVCYQLNRRGHFLVQSTLHPEPPPSAQSSKSPKLGTTP
jgi:peptidoglycan-associated lipoprotein